MKNKSVLIHGGVHPITHEQVLCSGAFQPNAQNIMVSQVFITHKAMAGEVALRIDAHAFSAGSPGRISLALVLLANASIKKAFVLEYCNFMF